MSVIFSSEIGRRHTRSGMSVKSHVWMRMVRRQYRSLRKAGLSARKAREAIDMLLHIGSTGATWTDGKS